jgi:hypothetical protein
MFVDNQPNELDDVIERMVDGKEQTADGAIR